jgi:hypothetical protein
MYLLRLRDALRTCEIAFFSRSAVCQRSILIKRPCVDLKNAIESESQRGLTCPYTLKFELRFQVLYTLFCARRLLTPREACAASVFTLGCQIIRYLKPVSSAGGFRTWILRLSASTLANRCGAVRITFVPGTYRVAAPKYGSVITVRRRRPYAASRFSGICWLRWECGLLPVLRTLRVASYSHAPRWVAS